MNESYIEKGVSIKAVNTFFENSGERNNEIRCVEIFSKGKEVLKIAQPPFSLQDKAEVYSLSKTFTATAIGILCDRGLLSVEDYVVDIFPDKCPEKISENLKKLKVKHLLSMNTGQSGCCMGLMFRAEDAVKEFLKTGFTFEPGTHFAYNTGATCMLSAIVERKSRESLFEFVTENLFHPLGIRNSRWNGIDDGTIEGGVGLHISCDDILKLGQLYLNKGVFEEKRILSEKWVEEATAFISDNIGNGTPDWCAGYGYQIWLNDKEGYRGDGAMGQFCIVLPNHDAVVAMTTVCGDMQGMLEDVYKLIDNLYDSGENILFQSLEAETFAKCRPQEYDFMNKYITLAENPFGFSKVLIEYESDCLAVRFVNRFSEQTVYAGNGEYKKSRWRASWKKPKLLGLMHAEREEEIYVASIFKVENNKITILMKHLNNPMNEYMIIGENKGKLYIEFKCDFLAENARLLRGK